ncbi:MAG: Tn3 family transposase, partial [Methyloprofundus sp.]|nr:Tn3 family transposase [Methyloprofundus sp.]
SRMPEDRCIATLVSFIYVFEIVALDDALDVLDMLLTQITADAKKLNRQKRLRSIKDLDKSALTLAKVCTLILDDETGHNDLREAIFILVSKENIAQSVVRINEIVSSGNHNFQDEMVEQYGRVRRFLPHLLDKIDFKSASAGKEMLEALNYLRKLEGSRKKNLENVPLDIVPKSWERLVFDQDKQVNKRAYTLCVLDRLQDKLRRRDIYVESSDRWGDPREKLLSGKDWATNKLQICRTLGHPLGVDEAIKSLTDNLDSAYQQAEANFSKNGDVRIEFVDEKPTLTITNLDKLDEPPSLIKLRQQVADFLPPIDLTELLLEIHAHTGFADEFTHISESNSRADDLAVSICAVLLSEACNIGIDPFIKHNNPALTRHRLNWVKQNYMRAETLTAANSQLVDYHMTIPLSKAWGGGEVASADGMRFVTSVKTLNSGPNKKYFGSDRGITWYNFISDQFSGFHGIVVPGTLRDSIFVLEGLLEQQTRLNPIEIMTDTAGSSDMIFGLFWLLGYQFSPRLADAGESSFWRIDMDANYGALDEIASNCVKTDRITQHWDDMLRIAGSLKLGTIQASELIRSLLKSERPSSLARAIIDVGRINKTIYLLNFIDNKDYRRRILTQLNRGEGRHAVARVICHGQRGEIKKRYREGQEDQLGALGLVTNAVVLWNTLYIDAALNHMQDKGTDISQEDMGRLSPLQHSHINALGHYSFVLTDLISKGKLRPLNSGQDQANLNFALKVPFYF